MFRRLPTICAAAIVVVVPGMSPAHADGDLQSTLENVIASEALYDNIELVLETAYSLGAPKYTTGQALKTGTEKVRYVLQNGMAFSDASHLEVPIEAKTQKWSETWAYDGELTRYAQGKLLYNIHDGKVEMRPVSRPHTLLLKHLFVTFPLSHYLKGDEVLRGNAAAGMFADWHTAARVVGPDRVGDLSCVKVAVDTKRSEKVPLTTALLWLAVDRNYLPVRLEWHEEGVQDPWAIGTAMDLREVAPGVWFPFSGRYTSYDGHSAKEDGKRVVAFTDEWRVKKATLDPRYEKSFFSDIPIPYGAAVYRVKDGKITSSYYEGIEPPPTGTNFRPRLAVGAGVLAIVAAIAGVVLYRMRHRGTSDAHRV